MGDTLLSLLETPEFRELLRQASRAPLLRRQLSGDMIPVGYSEDTVWDVLIAIRKGQANFSSVISCEPDGTHRNWHTETASLRLSLEQLTNLTREGSELHTIIGERKNSRFITQEYLEEVLVCLHYDGYDPDYESIRSVVLGERACSSEAERLAVNYHQIMRDLDRFAERPFDPALLVDLYGQLTSGVQGEECASAPARHLLPMARSAGDAEYVLGVTSAIANDWLTEPTLHPIMVSMLVSCRFWCCLPFERCNHLMSGIAGRLYLIKQGYPVFRYAKKISIIDEWKRGGRMADLVDYTFEESIVTNNKDTDWTAYYDAVMKMMLHSLERMHRTLRTMKDSDDEVLSQVDQLTDLNYRQQMLLHQAVVSPVMDFFIAAHRRKHGIVYSTARIDLEQLVERGFLMRRIDGATNVYRAAPNLHDILREAASRRMI